MSALKDFFKYLDWPNKIEGYPPLTFDGSETHGSYYWCESQWPLAAKFLKGPLSRLKPFGASKDGRTWKCTIHFWTNDQGQDCLAIGIQKQREAA